MRHKIAMTLLSSSQTDGDVSLEPVSALKIGSAHSLSGMAAVGGFGAGPTAPSPSVTSGPADTSSRRSSVKQRRRSANIIRAPIASAEELSPTSPQGITPSGSEGPGIHQLPVDNKSFKDDSLDSEFSAPRYEQAARGKKTKAPNVSTFADSNDNVASENVAVPAVSQIKVSSHKPASKLGKTTGTVPPAVSDYSSRSQIIDNSLPASLPSVPGAVRRPDSFVHAMSDELVLANEPRRGRGARSPILETQPEEELSSIFEFSV